MNNTQLSDVIMFIYENALSGDGWPKALQRIAEISGSEGCRIVVQSHSGAQQVYSFENGIALQSIGQLLSGENAMTPPSQEPLPVGEPIIRSRIVGEHPAAANGGHWQAERKHVLSDALTLVLLNSTLGTVVLEAIKTAQQGLYTDEELELIKLLGPHISRAICISDNLNLSRMNADMFKAGLDALSVGVYLVSRQDYVVYLNLRARSQVASGRVLQLLDDRLVPTDREAHKRLQARLRDTTSAYNLDLGDERRNAIALPDGDGSGFVAHVVPLHGVAASSIGRKFGAAAAIFVQDPAAAPIPANAAFARLYRLTEAELRLLNGLVPGLTLAQCAQLVGISEATAKTHLQRIFAKTKTSKQAELLYLLMTATPPTSSR